VLAGSAELIDEAWRYKQMWGGAMRQAGIVAAAGVYALDYNIERLAEDHARARRLAEAWAEQGLPVDLERAQTNFVHLDASALGLGEWEAVGLVRDVGVEISRTMRPGFLRAVTHLDLTDDDIDRAAVLVPQALGAYVHA
jgi:threonine aldolase